MLVRLEKHVREQEEARGRAEADLERVMGQMSMGQEGRLAAEDRMREMEAELESARVEARRATALLDQAAEITRARVESEWAVRFTRAQADAETRAARLMLENQRLQQELHYRTDMMGAEASAGVEHDGALLAWVGFCECNCRGSTPLLAQARLCLPAGAVGGIAWDRPTHRDWG